ncbi:MAG TPA: LysE family transporter [Steroidobacteraceae bacterium]|jgi:threonine/homoserine/homoserine lactone efflux protein
MSLPWLLKGLAIGFSVAAPVGPIGLLCIRRSMTDGARTGFVCGLGAATADAMYALIGAIAVTGLARWLVAQQRWFGLAGGLFLLYLGLRTLVPGAARHSGIRTIRGNALSSYASTLLLTLANPMTIMSFAAVFAGIGLAAAPTYLAAAQLTAAVFFGSAAWWWLLSAVAGRAQRFLGGAALQVINCVCGLMIAAFGAYAVISARY